MNLADTSDTQREAPVFTREQVYSIIAGELLRASEDILYFASKIYTHDPHADGNRLVKFPDRKRYIREVLKIAAWNPRFAIFKSRQMMVTWIICIVCLWEAIFKPGARIALISMKEEDAGRLIGDRIKLMYDHLPEHWKIALPEANYYKGKKGIILRMVVNHPGGLNSVIQAYPQNGNPGRSETLSLAYWDEVGLCDDLESRAMYASLRPTLENGGRLIMSSTPPMDPDHFWSKFCSGEYFGG